MPLRANAFASVPPPVRSSFASKPIARNPSTAPAQSERRATSALPEGLAQVHLHLAFHLASNLLADGFPAFSKRLHALRIKAAELAHQPHALGHDVHRLTALNHAHISSGFRIQSPPAHLRDGARSHRDGVPAFFGFCARVRRLTVEHYLKLPVRGRADVKHLRVFTPSITSPVRARSWRVSNTFAP